MKLSCWLVISCIVLGGCATAIVTIGTDFEASKISLIEKGKTDKLTVSKLFGTPYQKSLNEDQERWHYIYLVTKSDAISFSSLSVIESDTRTKKLNILFDSLGVVTSYDYNIPGDVNFSIQKPDTLQPIIEEKTYYPNEARKLVKITTTNNDIYEVFIAGESASKYYVLKQLSDTTYIPIRKSIIKKIEKNH